MRLVPAAWLCALAVFVPAIAAAGHDDRADEGAGFGYFEAGWQRIFIGELKGAVRSAGYPAVSDNFATFGGGGHAVIRNFYIVGGEGAGLSSGESSRGSYRVGLSGGYGFFNVGVLAYRHRELRIYPMLGLGGGGLDLTITETRGGSFNDILRAPGRSTSVSTGEFLMQGALGVDWLLNFSGDPLRGGGILLGLRFGYVVNPLGNMMSWDSDGAPIVNAPADIFHGPYVRLVIGGGGHGQHGDHDGCREHEKK